MNILIEVFYNLPAANTESVDYMYNILAHYSFLFKDIINVGDFNLNFMTSNTVSSTLRNALEFLHLEIACSSVGSIFFFQQS